MAFEVRVKETDLFVKAERHLAREALASVKRARGTLEGYIRAHPRFRTTLEPYAVEDDAPLLVVDMARAAERAGVGPMAAVAGAVAEYVGRDLLELSAEVVVENGGDVFLATRTPRLMGIWAGSSPLSGKVALKIAPRQTPMGVCTSSGTVGHSLSFGCADAAVVLSPSTALADAAATALGNLIQGPQDIPKALERARRIEGVTGAVLIVGDRLGACGDVELERL